MAWPRRKTVLIVALLSLLSPRVFAHQPEFPPAFPPIRPEAVPLVQMPGAEPAREEEPENPFEDAIETDRDSFTPATTTVGRGRLVIESAYSFLDNRGVKETHSFPELLGRYGLTERLELRLGWNYEVGGVGSDTSGSDVGTEELAFEKGLQRDSKLVYGMKYQVTKQDAWLPNSVVILQASTPTSGTETNTLVVGTYAFGWELPGRWKLDAAIRYGMGKESDDHFNEWAPSVVLKVPFGERLLAHAEYFGLFSTGKAQEFTRHYFSPGLHYLVTPNLEVGFRVGWGLNDQSARFSSNVGFGCRF